MLYIRAISHSYPDLQSLSLQFPFTIVSAYIVASTPQKGTHTAENFFGWMKNFYLLNHPMVLFLPSKIEHSYIISNATSMRKELYPNIPTIIVPFEEGDMETYLFKDMIASHFKL